jgi:uncharacterized membrane protein YdjX (TVP38/TMEM64 family)
MVEAVLLAGGFVLGVAVGRWPALLAAVALGAWIAAATHVEVPHWFLGLAYTVISGVGIAAGVWLRHSMRAHRSRHG